VDERAHEAEASREGFLALARQSHAQLPTPTRGLAADVVAALPDWRVPRDGGDMGPDFDAAISEAYRVLGDPRSAVVFSTAVVAELAADLPERLADRRLPPDVLALVPAALGRLLRFLRLGDVGDYRWGSSDFLLKDIRFVAGLTVPVGAGVADLRGVIGRKKTVALAVRRPTLPAAAALLRGRGLEPWFSFHTEVRHLEEFDEPGWDRAYLRLASLLRRHREVQGITAAGWLYDPQTRTVAPRLAHLHQRPLERGAVLVPGRTGDVDIANALANSATRRRLQEEGRYVPVPHTMLWPRKQLLAWARRQGGERSR
jgi:hypothetical protein